MNNLLTNQQTDKILAEFFTVAEVPADKIELVRNWMRPVIDMALVHHHISQAAQEIGMQAPGSGHEAEAARINKENQSRIVV